MKKSTPTEETRLIERKVTTFIRRFYWVRAVQGILLTLMVFAILFLLAFLIDLLLKLPPGTNGFLFWSVIVTGTAAGCYLALWPAAQALGFANRMSYKEAGGIIAGKHEKIRDQIINIIELRNEQKENNSLVREAIRQKTENIKWYNFNQAVPLKKLGEIVIYSAASLLTITLLTLIWPEFVKTGYQSVIRYNKTAEKQDCRFTVLSGEMKVEAGMDYELQFEVMLGNITAEQAEIRIGSRREPVIAEEGIFRYTFFTLNNPVSFVLISGSCQSAVFTIDVLRRPEIGEIRLTVEPPGYTGLNKMLKYRPDQLYFGRFKPLIQIRC